MEPLRFEFVVGCPPERAFALWAEQTTRWWPPGHSVSGERGLTVTFEPGGRIYERTPDGTEHEWGEVLVWEPPQRLVYLWHLRFDRSDATEVEITFAPHADGTAVVITHSGWERLGADRRERNKRGWSGVLPRFRIAALVDVDELVIEEWTGDAGPVAPPHVHHEDDEAWLAIEGVLVVRVEDEDVRIGPGEVVRVPAGTPHAYAIAERARYLIAMTPRIRELVARLHEPGETDWAAYASERLV
jgi:quercetin dioxygenase-like cupin family protein